MSLIKCRHEYKTLLEFKAGKKISKSHIKKLLRTTPIITYYKNDKQVIRVTPDIDIGIYKIRLNLNDADILSGPRKLRNYGTFSVSIYEKHNNECYAPAGFSKLFKDQYWAGTNTTKAKLRIKDLVHIITYCDKINRLKLFL